MKSLFKVAGALPFMLAVFLNAFVDLGHKIVIQNTIFKVYDGAEQVVLTAIVNSLILLPFILLMAPAGMMSDKYPKNQVMRVAAWAAVVICVGIGVCYYAGWFWPAFGLTFLLAVQSAFYSPAKLGYLKALFGKESLAQANGVVQAIAIVAILAGTLLFSIVFELWYSEELKTEADILQAVAPLAWLLIINSVIELVMMYRLPQLEQEDQSIAFSWGDLLSGRSTWQGLQPLKQRKVIGLAVMGLAMFWSIGQVMLAAFPAFAKAQLEISNTMVIQGILAASGLGIAVGSALASLASKRHIEIGLLPIGAVGIALGLGVLSSLDSAAAHASNFFFIGVAGGLFIVPLNALIQFHSDEHELGKVLAANNWVQNIAMLSFLVLTASFALAGISAGYLLQMIAIFSLIAGLYTIWRLPQSLIRFVLLFIMSRHYRVNVEGMANIPEKGGVLLLGNHISWIDWAIVQLACPRPLRFVMDHRIYHTWYLRWFFKAMGCVPLEQGDNAQKALDQVAKLLDSGEAVCLFPEGTISRTGHLAQFRRGYLRATEQLQQPCRIVPFYLHGLWGSQLSRAQQKHKNKQQGLFQRQLLVAFGSPLSAQSRPEHVKRAVADLSVDAWAAYNEHQQHFVEQLFDHLRCNKKQRLYEVASVQGKTERYTGLNILSDSLALLPGFSAMSATKIGIFADASYQQMCATVAALLAGKQVRVVESITNLDDSQLDLLLLPNSRSDLDCQQMSFEQVFANRAKSGLLKSLMLQYLPIRLAIRFYVSKARLQQSQLQFFNAQGALVDFSLSNLSLHSLQLAGLLNPNDDEKLVFPVALNMDNGEAPKSRLMLFMAQFLPLLQAMRVCVFSVTDEDDGVALAKYTAKSQAHYLALRRSQIEAFIEQDEIKPAYLSPLNCVIALDVIERDLILAFKAKFACGVLQGLSVAEGGAVLLANIPDALDTRSAQVQIGEKLGSLGMPLPGVSVRVLDESGNEVDAGELGVLSFRAAQQAKGKDAQWCLSDYRAYLDEDGFVYIPELRN